MTIPNTIIAITCTCFAAQTNAFAPASSTISVSRNTLTRRIPTRVQDSFLDDPILLNIPTAMKGSTTETAPDQKYNKVNNRHSSRDWLHNVASIPRSSVLREIMNPVLTISAWSTLVSIIHRGLITSSSPFQNLLAVNMCVPTQVHSFLVSSLGLLLVFRTNSAYQRFVEGRRIWEQILSTSRNLSRMLSLYESEIGTEKISRIKKTLAAFPYLLRHHIRPKCLNCVANVPKEHQLKIQQPPFEVIETRYEGDRSDEGAIMDLDSFEGQTRSCIVDKRTFPWSLLENNALKKCANAVNRPLWSCDRIAAEVVSIPYSETFTSRERLTLIGQADKLSNAIGECERIHQTTVPLNYARHALRSLTLWLATLPFALVKDLGLLTGPVTGITAWLFFGIYQIGHSIEDPFQKTLRLSILCNAIRRDVLGENESRSSAFSLDDTSPDLMKNSTRNYVLNASSFQ